MPKNEAGNFWDELDADADGQDDGDEGQENQSNDDQGNEDDGLDPKLVAFIERQLTKREEELARAIESGDTKNGVYKNLQRSMAKKDKTITELRSLLSQFEGQMEAQQDGFNWLANTTLEALPEDTRKLAELALKERTIAFREKQLTKPRTPVAEDDSDEDFPAEVPPEIRARIVKFEEGRKAAVKKLGLDPDDPRIDYGGRTEGILERMEKWENSVEKLQAEKESKAEKEISSVRQRTQPVGTRSTGASAPVTGSDGLTRLERGIQARLREIESGKFDRHRR